MWKQMFVCLFVCLFLNFGHDQNDTNKNWLFERYFVTAKILLFIYLFIFFFFDNHLIVIDDVAFLKKI